MRIKAKIIKSLQFEYTHKDYIGKTSKTKKRYVDPHAAAKEWAYYMTSNWVDKKFSLNGCAAYHNMNHKDYEWKRKIEEKAYRRALPVIKRMLAET